MKTLSINQQKFLEKLKYHFIWKEDQSELSMNDILHHPRFYDDVFQNKNQYDERYITDSKGKRLFGEQAKDEIKRLKTNIVKHYLEALVKKGEIEKIDIDDRKVYRLKVTLPLKQEKKQSTPFTQFLCEIDRIDKSLGDIHTFKDARQIAYEKYNISKHEFDTQFRQKLDEDFYDFDLGQGIMSGLSPSDSLNISTSRFDSPYFYFRLQERFKSKYCQK